MTNNRSATKDIIQKATATITTGAMLLTPVTALADDGVDEEFIDEEIPAQVIDDEQPSIQIQEAEEPVDDVEEPVSDIEEPVAEADDQTVVYADEVADVDDAPFEETVDDGADEYVDEQPTLMASATPTDQVDESAKAPETKEEAGEQLEAAKEETQQAANELGDATAEEETAQKAVNDELAREEAATKDAEEKNKTAEDTKADTEADLDAHIKAGDEAFDGDLPMGHYDEWVGKANEMEDIYSDEGKSQVTAAKKLRDDVTRERQNELDKAAAANAEFEASRSRLDGIQTYEQRSQELNANPTFLQALLMATGTSWLNGAPALDLANKTFVGLYEQYLDLANDIANKSTVLDVFTGADTGAMEDTDAATARYKWISRYKSEAEQAKSTYDNYRQYWNDEYVPQHVAGDSVGATKLLTDLGLATDSWQVRYVQETGTLYDALTRAQNAARTAHNYTTMLGGDDSWTNDDYAQVEYSDTAFVATYMSLNTYHDPAEPGYTYHGMVDQLDAVLNEEEWRSDKLAREFLGNEGAYEAWDKAGRPDLGKEFDSFVAKKYAEAHDVVAKNVTFTRATSNLGDLKPNLPNNHLGDLGTAYSNAGAANDIAAQNDGAAGEKAALEQAQKAKKVAQDKYDDALLKQGIAQFIYDNWTDPDLTDDPTEDPAETPTQDPTQDPTETPTQDTPEVKSPDSKPGTSEATQVKAPTTGEDSVITNITKLSPRYLPATGDDNLQAVSGFLAMAGTASLALVVLCRRKDESEA